MPDTTGLPITNIGTSLRSVSGHDAYREDQTLQGLPVKKYWNRRSMRPNETMAKGVKRTQESMADKKCEVYGTK